MVKLETVTFPVSDKVLSRRIKIGNEILQGKNSLGESDHLIKLPSYFSQLEKEKT